MQSPYPEKKHRKEEGGIQLRERKPYNQRTDIERIASQWKKLTGLHTREEWSAAVVRAATAAEIAANLAIRREFALRSQFDERIVNHFLKWANGIDGKLKNVLLPLLEGQDKHSAVKKLYKLAASVNAKRNAIAHRGEFCNEGEAAEVIGKSREFVVGLVRLYEVDFILNDEC
jgi:hypothetical protein